MPSSLSQKVDDRETTIRMQVMDKMKLLLATEPGEPGQYGFLNMVFLVKIVMCIERHCARSGHHEKEV